MRFARWITAAGLTLLVGVQGCSSDEAPPPQEKVVENHPGKLVLTAPARAAFLEAGSGAVEVKGTGATSALTIDGEAVEVAPDGSFHTTVRPEVGLNVIVAQDGENRLESPFLYGHFVPATTPVGQAVSVEIGSGGINAAPPAASLMTIANDALQGRDLLAMVKGQTFSGEAVGAKWSYAVSGGHNGAVAVDLGSASKGLEATATLQDLVIEGTLTIDAFGLKTSRFTRILVERATVAGETELAIENGTLEAAMPAAQATLDGFTWDSGNLGFPCCIDSIASSFLRPKIEEAIANGVRTEVPNALKVTLDGIGLPKQLDLSAMGLTKPIPVAARFDGGTFDLSGAQVTASVLFGGSFAPGSPGAKAPGWLKLGAGMHAGSRPVSLGASFSVDAVNQLLFAAWGSGDLAFTLPAPARLKLTAAMPPVLTVTSTGAVRVGIGELVVQQADAATPMAAVTALQDVVPSGDQDALVLTPKGEPTISITWLADESQSSGKNLIAAAAKDQITKLLKPFRLPLPRMALDQLGGGFTGKSLGMQSLRVEVDPRASRLAASGTMTLGKSSN